MIHATAAKTKCIDILSKSFAKNGANSRTNAADSQLQRSMIKLFLMYT